MKNGVKNLIEFIDHSPSCFHVIENARKQFLDHGFMELKEKEENTIIKNTNDEIKRKRVLEA